MRSRIVLGAEAIHFRKHRFSGDREDYAEQADQCNALVAEHDGSASCV
jgi:hypothetical protein